MKDIDYLHIAKWIMRITIGAIAAMAVLLISVQFLEPAIGNKSIQKIQKELQVPSSTQSFRLSIFKNFPKLSVVLTHVQVEGQNGTDFLRAEEVSLKMNVWNLIKGRYIFESIVLENADIYISVDENDQGNWNIFKPSDDSSTINMIWNQVDFKNVHIAYADAIREIKTDFIIHKGSMQGGLSGSQITLLPRIDMEFISVVADGTDYINRLPVSIKDGQVLVDMEDSFYKFDKLKLDAANSGLLGNGSIHNRPEGIYFDLEFHTDKGDLNSIQNALPLFLTESIKTYDVEGTAAIHCSYKGLLDTKYVPSFTLDIDLKKSLIDHKDFPTPIRISEGSAVLRLNKYSNGTFYLSDFRGAYDKEPISASISISDIDKMIIDATFDGNLPLRLFQPYFPTFAIHDGTLGIRNLEIAGLQFIRDDIKFTKLGGGINGTSIRFDYEDQRIAVPVFKGELNPYDMLILDTCRVIYSGTDASLRGSVKNFMGSILHPLQNDLAFDLYLDSKNMDLDELYQLYDIVSEPVADKVQVTDNKNEQSIALFAKATGRFKAEVQNLNYGIIRGSGFLGDLFIDRDAYKIHGEVQTCEGLVSISGKLDNTDLTSFDGILEVKDVDITQLFTQWENFGQDFIRAEHIQGRISGQAKIDLQWNEDGAFLFDNMDLISSTRIRDGFLKNLTMLEAFSSYVDVADLRAIQFTELNNLLVIRDGNIYLPAMFIQSNAMNLTVNGVHTLDNRVDYNIKINGGQILMKRFKGSTSEIIPARKDGWFNLYYTVMGTLPEDFTYKRDKKKVLSSFAQSLDFRNRNESILKESFPNLTVISEPQDWKNALFEEGDYLIFDTIEGF